MLSRVLILSALLCLACPEVYAAAVGVNLLRNGTAEAGAFSSTGAPVAVPGWTTSSAFTVVNYGAAGGFPTASDPGPPDRGNQFFAGGNASVSTATQTIDVSANAAGIDSGKALVDLSGWLGGYADDADSATIEVAFFNGTTKRGSATIGPVTAADRFNTTELVFRAVTATVPVGTKRFVVTMTMTKAPGGAFNDGYADSLSLVLRVPVTVTSKADSGPGTLRAAMRAGSVISFDEHVFAPETAPHVITLATALPQLQADVVIVGPGADVLTIKRSTAPATAPFRIFSVEPFRHIFFPDAIISGLTITNGSGGIAIQSASLTLNDCAVIGNTAAGASGGGVYSDNSNLQVSRCLFAGNAADSLGGGIFFGSSLTATQATIANCTFSGNTANPGQPAGGGGLTVQGSFGVSAAATLHSCTFAGNSDGIFVDQYEAGSAVAHLDNTILTSVGPNLIRSSAPQIVSDGFNLSDRDDSAVLNQSGDRNNSNPMLGPLADHGGPTMTHALLPGSLAIDKGDTGLGVDQRGFGRPIDDPNSANGGGNKSDIGAFEFTPPRHYETESLMTKAVSGGQHTIIKDPKLNGGAGTLLANTTVGSFVSYFVAIPGAGIYDVKVRVKTGPTRGKFQLAIDDVNIGVPRDEYSSGVGYKVLDFGQVQFASGGAIVCRFTVTGKNANSTGTSLTFDSIQLTPP